MYKTFAYLSKNIVGQCRSLNLISQNFKLLTSIYKLFRIFAPFLNLFVSNFQLPTQIYGKHEPFVYFLTKTHFDSRIVPKYFLAN